MIDKIKRNIFLFLFLGNAISVSESINIEFTNEIDQIIMDSSRCDCQVFIGKKFLECMAYQSKEHLKKNFQNLGVEARKNYLSQLSLNEYIEFIENYDEEDWQSAHQSLPDEKKAMLIGTKEDQINMLKKTFILFLLDHDKDEKSRSNQWGAAGFGGTGLGALCLGPLALAIFPLAMLGDYMTAEDFKSFDVQELKKRVYESILHQNDVQKEKLLSALKDIFEQQRKLLFINHS